MLTFATETKSIPVSPKERIRRESERKVEKERERERERENKEGKREDGRKREREAGGDRTQLLTLVNMVIKDDKPSQL